MRLVAPLLLVILVHAAAGGPEYPVRTGNDGLVYVRIPPGSAMLGCAAADRACFDWEKRAHRVTFRNGFWIGRTEVTQRAYQRITGTNPSRYKGADRPVEQISWNDAPATALRSACVCPRRMSGNTRRRRPAAR